MRQIKFRAWDKDREEFISGGMVLIAVLCGSNPKNSPIYLDYKPCDACKLPLNNADHYKDRFVLQQFTGLQDKHGKDIYEGDAIKVYMGGDLQAHHYIVEWGEYGWNPWEKYNIDNYTRITGQRIIGNIYEDEDLLEAAS